MMYEKSSVLQREGHSFYSLKLATEWAERRSTVFGMPQVVRKEDDNHYTVNTWSPGCMMYGDVLVNVKLFYKN